MARRPALELSGYRERGHPSSKEHSGGESVSPRGNFRCIIEDAPRPCSLRPKLFGSGEFVVGVGRIVHLRRAMQAIVRKSAPSAGLPRVGVRLGVGCDPGDLMLCQEDVGLRVVPCRMPGLTEDITGICRNNLFQSFS
jgi:hypothetical protein